MDRESWNEYLEEDGSRIRLGVTADVTDWKEREHRQALTDNWLKVAVDGGRIGLWSDDIETRAYLWNENMFMLLGYRAGEVSPPPRHGMTAFIPTISGSKERD